MLAHLTKSGIRALAASIVTGSILIYATGGLDTPYVTPLVGVSIATFFIFWIAFALFFARPPRVNNSKVSSGLTDGGGYSPQRSHRRDHDEHGHDGEAGSDGGDGGGDGGGGSD